MAEYNGEYGFITGPDEDGFYNIRNWSGNTSITIDLLEEIIHNKNQYRKYGIFSGPDENGYYTAKTRNNKEFVLFDGEMLGFMIKHKEDKKNEE